MRKRLNDGEKQQTLESAGAHHSTALPDPSDSFQEFLRPLLGQLPPRFRLKDLRDPLLIAAAVWNEVIATKGNVAGAVADVAEMIEEFQQRPVSAKLRTMLEALAARKSSAFGNDDRLVEDLEVYRQGADVRVVARTMSAPGMNAVLVPGYSVRSSVSELAIGRRPRCPASRSMVSSTTSTP